MTKQQLNAAVKKLTNDYKAHAATAKDKIPAGYFEHIDNVIKPEFKRLYGADNSLKSFTADNLRRMIRLNVKLRAIPFHQFGLMIDL